MATTDEEVVQALRYLHMRQLGWTMAQIAKSPYFNLSRSGLYHRIHLLEERGKMEKARYLYFIPTLQDVRDTQLYVLSNWAAIVQRQVRTAIHARSDKTALEAAAWLKSQYIDPALEDTTGEGNPEESYAKRNVDLNPTTIIVPRALKKDKPD